MSKKVFDILLLVLSVLYAAVKIVGEKYRLAETYDENESVP